MPETTPSKISLVNFIKSLRVVMSRLAVFFTCFVVMVLIIRPVRFPMNPTIDTSFGDAYAYFMTSHQQAGLDYIFTYGPLGHFIHSFFRQELFWIGYVTIISLGLAATASFAYAFLRNKGLFPRVFFVIAAILFLPPTMPDTLYHLAAVGAAIHLAHRENNPPPILYYLFTFFMALLSLCKFTLLITCFGLTLYLTLSLFIQQQKRTALFTLCSFTACILSLWLASGQSLLSIVPYLKGSLEISKAYSAGMNTPVPSNTLILMALTLLISFTLFLMTQKGNTFKIDTLLNITLCGVLYLLAWKHGTVRHGQGHVMNTLALLFILPLYWSLPKSLPKKWTYIRNTGLCIMLVTSLLLGSQVYRNLGSFMRDNAFKRPYKHIVETLPYILTPASTRSQLINTRNKLRRIHSFPTFASEVGHQSIDMFPPHQAIIFHNELNYTPRPVIQGYQASNSTLLDLNRDFYEGQRDTLPPEYIFFRLLPLDGRFPAMEDSQALLSILTHYTPVLEEYRYYLYKRTPNISKPTPVPLQQGFMGFGEKITLPPSADKWQLLSLNFENTLQGKVRAIAYQQPNITLTVEHAPNLSKSYRIIPSMTERPFVINPLLEMENIPYDSAIPTSAPPRITSFTIEIDPAHISNFTPKIAYSLFEIEEPAGALFSPILSGSQPKTSD